MFPSLFHSLVKLERHEYYFYDRQTSIEKIFFRRKSIRNSPNEEYYLVVFSEKIPSYRAFCPDVIIHS